MLLNRQVIKVNNKHFDEKDENMSVINVYALTLNC